MRLKTFLEGNEEVIQEAEMAINDFPKVLKAFITSHPEEFIAESLEETYKNIRVFTEVAVAQYATEVTNIYGSNVVEEEAIAEEKLADYI